MTVIKNQINVQDQFLNQFRRDRNRVAVELVTGRKLEGIIVGFDNFSLVLRGEADHLVYKHAISSISHGGKMGLSENR
jgi:host factor-I protein